MKEKFILALDQGTTSSRAILFDKNGNAVSTSQIEFQQIYPNAAWIEHDAMEILRTQTQVAQQAIQNHKISTEEIAAIGITNQRETTVIWDKNTGYPIHNAIVWQDRRTAEYCDSIRAAHAKTIQEKTGLILDAYFSATKIKWLLDNVEGAREKAEKGDLLFGTMDTWLIWNLSERENKAFVTDYTNASRTMLFNIKTGEWDDELLKIFDVPKSMLPRVVASSGIAGYSSSGIFGRHIPIAGIAGDQQAATYGNDCLKKGMIKNTYGTGCFMVQNTGDFVASKNKLLTIPAWHKDGKTTYGLEGSIFIGGAVVQWLRDELQIIDNAPAVEKLALKSKDNGGVYLVPAFAGLGAPTWDSYARGTLIGITRGTNRSHIARAALESIAYQSADLALAMQADNNGQAITTLRADGGATANNLLMQFQADILGIPVERPKIVETTALGAAFLAGICVGFWDNEAEIERIWQLDARFEPTFSADQREYYMHMWHKALGRSQSWAE